MSQIAVMWGLVPDGDKTIVQVSIHGEFRISSSSSTSEVEAYVARLVSQISTQDEATIREKLFAERWLGDWPRPEESVGPALIESEESIPSTRRAPLWGWPSLSTRDVVLLGALSVFALFGFFSIAQFLQQVAAGGG